VKKSELRCEGIEEFSQSSNYSLGLSVIAFIVWQWQNGRLVGLRFEGGIGCGIDRTMSMDGTAELICIMRSSYLSLLVRNENE